MFFFSIFCFLLFLFFFFFFFFFFFNDTATTEIYTLSLHDALPIFQRRGALTHSSTSLSTTTRPPHRASSSARSEEHTSELQSRSDLVCRLLLEKKNESQIIEHNYQHNKAAH